jgi:hypothetical protein
MNIIEFNRWIAAAPPQISRTFLRNMAQFLDYEPPPGVRTLVQFMLKPEHDQGESLAVPLSPENERLHQMLTLSEGLWRVASDRSRPEKTVDHRAHLEAWMAWMQRGPDWLQQLLLDMGREMIAENQLTRVQLLDALWLSEGHE